MSNNTYKQPLSTLFTGIYAGADLFSVLKNKLTTGVTMDDLVSAYRVASLWTSPDLDMGFLVPIKRCAILILPNGSHNLGTLYYSGNGLDIFPEVRNIAPRYYRQGIQDFVQYDNARCFFSNIEDGGLVESIGENPYDLNTVKGTIKLRCIDLDLEDYKPYWGVNEELYSDGVKPNIITPHTNLAHGSFSIYPFRTPYKEIKRYFKDSIIHVMGKIIDAKTNNKNEVFIFNNVITRKFVRDGYFSGISLDEDTVNNTEFKVIISDFTNTPVDIEKLRDQMSYEFISETLSYVDDVDNFKVNYPGLGTITNNAPRAIIEFDNDVSYGTSWDLYTYTDTRDEESDHWLSQFNDNIVDFKASTFNPTFASEDITPTKVDDPMNQYLAHFNYASILNAIEATSVTFNEWIGDLIINSGTGTLKNIETDNKGVTPIQFMLSDSGILKLTTTSDYYFIEVMKYNDRYNAPYFRQVIRSEEIRDLFIDYSNNMLTLKFKPRQDNQVYSERICMYNLASSNPYKPIGYRNQRYIYTKTGLVDNFDITANYYYSGILVETEIGKSIPSSDGSTTVTGLKLNRLSTL